jgi:hypothetical protein
LKAIEKQSVMIVDCIPQIPVPHHSSRVVGGEEMELELIRRFQCVQFSLFLEGSPQIHLRPSENLRVEVRASVPSEQHHERESGVVLREQFHQILFEVGEASLVVDGLRRLVAHRVASHRIDEVDRRQSVNAGPFDVTTSEECTALPHETGSLLVLIEAGVPPDVDHQGYVTRW